MYERTYKVEGEDQLHVGDRTSSDSGGGDEERSPTDLNGILLAHIQTYAIGEYYDIPTLKTFALERFTAATSSGWQLDGLVSVIKAVDERIRHDDRALRDVLLSHLVKHATELQETSSFMDELSEAKDIHHFTADLFQHTVRQWMHDRREGELRVADRDRQNKLEKELFNHVDKVAKSWEEKFKEKEADLSNLLQAVKAVPKECRNKTCDREFPALTYEHKDSPKEGWMVRCTKCKCKLVQ